MSATDINSLPEPVLVVGASGFIGANILRALLAERDDVVGTIFSGHSWRLANVPSRNVSFLNLQDHVSVQSLLARVSPKVVFDCSSFGAYSFEKDFARIHATNYVSFINFMESLMPYDLHAYIHAGSSSEYGLNSAGPAEDSPLVPNSHYAVSKASAAHAVAYYGKTCGLPIANLRLYSVYGPYEDSSRLIPVLCEHVLRKKLPPFVNPNVSRDFLFVGDAVEAFVACALRMNQSMFGESYNIGTGVETSLGDLARKAAELFGLDEEIRFDSAEGRPWDMEHWFADTLRAEQSFGWKHRVALPEGLRKARDWWGDFLKHASFETLTKKQRAARTKNSVSAIIACYMDGQAIPIMYKRLVAVFTRLGLDYEIIFVNDASFDDSEETIRELSAQDPHVFGITHSRNFGAQAAFRSGMEMAGKESCVLLDGDLQDPPELIEEFVRLWKDGADVVYGCRVKRDMPRWMEFFYKLFYRIFAALSEIPMPRDAGDFSLMDREVVYWVLRCPEKDYFLRGLRAYVGFKQVGVDYVRSDREFAHDGGWLVNLGRAKKAIFSFTRVPLNLLTVLGGMTVVFTFLLALWAIFAKYFFPQETPRGVTLTVLLIMFFGSMIILGLGLLGEYIGKIFEETKSRPSFIRQHLIQRGKIEQIRETFFRKNLK
jgi:dolichol-phosphate mannosyltransferase